MDIATLSFVIFAALFILLMLRVPIGFATGSVAVIFGVTMFGPASLLLVASRIYDLISNYTLISVPLFILMGLVLEEAGVTEDLFRAMNRLTSSIPGGLAVATIGAAAVMGAILGVLGAEVVTLGLVALPAMLRYGYDRRFSAGLICAGGALGSLIPPSVILVLYGVIANVSISKLFIAAVGPALVYCLLFAAYVIAMAIARPDLVPSGRQDLVGDSTRNGSRHPLLSVGPGLAIAAAMFGSLYLGIATPTEIAAIGLTMAIAVAVGRRRLSMASLMGSIRKTSVAIGTVMFVFFGASALVSYYNLAQGMTFLTNIISGLPLPPLGIIFVMMIIWFVLEIFIDFIAILFLTIPIFLPVVKALGYDPIWFGILFCINMQMGYLTPPFAPAAFYLKSVAPPEITLSDIFIGSIPFVVLQGIGLILVILWPELALWMTRSM